MTSTTRLEAGQTAPAFTLPDQTGTPFSLAGLRGRKVVVYFYPEAMTPGCTTQSCDFRDNVQVFADAGFAVVGISRDTPEKNAEFAAAEGLDFPLLSDPDRAVHEAYGVWGEKQLYGKTVVGVIRSTFVVDEEGVLLQALYNVKATGHVAMLLKKLKLAA